MQHLVAPSSLQKRRHDGHKGLVVKGNFRESAMSQAEATMSPARVGWLEKRAQGMRYQKRFFVASGHYLRYFGDDRCKELLAVLDVRGADVRKDGKRIFRVAKKGTAFLVRCPNEPDRDDWVMTLRAMIKREDNIDNMTLRKEDSDESSSSSDAWSDGEERLVLKIDDDDLKKAEQQQLKEQQLRNNNNDDMTFPPPPPADTTANRHISCCQWVSC